MDLATLIFWIIAIILVGSALLVVSLPHIVHSALALIVVFAMAAGIYLLLNAEFIAIVLILFALMLTRQGTNVESNPNNRQWWLALPICALVGAGIIFAATISPHAISIVGNGAGQLPPGINNVVRIGQLLYSPTTYSYVLPFEIASLVLLVAIIGAIVIGRED